MKIKKGFGLKYFRKLSFGVLIIGVIVASMTGFQGCAENPTLGADFLQKPPTVKTTQDTIFSQANLANRFLTNAYRSLPYGPYGILGAFDSNQLNNDPLAALTDIGHSADFNGAAQSVYYNGVYNSTIESQQAGFTKHNYNNSGAWSGIRQAHIFINNVDRVPDMSEEEKQTRKAEARMIIALHYTHMFRHYGGVPWANKPFSPNDKLNLQRATAKATFDSTLAIINKAIPDLPFSLDDPQREAGRFTQASAMGLKVRLLLFAASPLFNSDQPFMEGEASSQELTWFGGYDPELWQRTADAARELIDKVEQTGDYHLADTGNPRADFKRAYFDRDSPEILISTRKRYKAGGFAPNSARWGGFLPTDNYVKKFPMADGSPIFDENGDPANGYDPANPYENRDPRLDKTVLLPGQPYQGRTAETWIGGRERKTKGARRAKTGYQARKFLLDIQTARNQPVQFPYLRLSGVYLAAAEAINEAEGPNAEAYEYINRVRNRVDLGDLQTIMNDPTSQQEFREAVLKERALELGYEQNRWFDMVRWKMDDAFQKQLYGLNICKKGESPSDACVDNGVGYHESAEFIYARFELLEREWAKDFSRKWYLSAFPREEILKTGMIQNPGW